MRQPGFLSTQHSCWINSRSSHENYKRRARTPTRARMPHVALVPARLGAVARGDAPRRVRAVASARVEASSSKRAPSRRSREKRVEATLRHQKTAPSAGGRPRTTVDRDALERGRERRGARRRARRADAEEEEERDQHHGDGKSVRRGRDHVGGDRGAKPRSPSWRSAPSARSCSPRRTKTSPQFQKRDRVENVRLGVVSDVNDAPGAA